MAQLSLFDDDIPPQASRLAPRLRALAEAGVYLGTSSWKYEGWIGSIYSEDRYTARGRFSRARFEAGCLEEYARTFPAVGGDFSFYQFPSPTYWRALFDRVPEGFRFVLKVPEEITVASWPGHARYGSRAGTPNTDFLDADLFRLAFARPLAPYRGQVGALVFEFGTFPRSTFATASAFLDRLGPFLESLPGGFRYSVEIRNPEYLGPDYFATLARHGVAHAFNAWTRMPDLEDQIDRPGSVTADFVVVRALLARGRPYEEAVTAFQPYERVREPNPGVRRALGRIIGPDSRFPRPSFLLVNNRLEGNAPGTIEAVAMADPG